MAFSLPLVMTRLRHPASMSSEGHGGRHPNGGGRWNEEPLNWCAWAHQGHRLWEAMPDSFWVYTYKVEWCPFPSNHVWLSCPYAHRGERARRRDPRRFPYVAAQCPEYEESKRQLRLAGSSTMPTCPRGLRCGYSHNVFETWLHPTRFRTVMCQHGAECPRKICFFAHSLAQRRREDDVVPLVVFPATQPPPTFVPRGPRLAMSASSSSRSCSQPVSVISRPVDHVTQAMQQDCNVRLLTRRFDVVGASSSSSSLAAITTSAAPTTLLSLSAPLLQALPSPVDDDDIDFVAMVTNCCLASEADSKAEGRDYLHFDYFMDIMRR